MIFRGAYSALHNTCRKTNETVFNLRSRPRDFRETTSDLQNDEMLFQEATSGSQNTCRKINGAVLNLR